MLTPEDASRIEVATQKRLDAFRSALLSDLHALVQDGIVEASYKVAVANALPEHSRLKARVEELERESERLRAALRDLLDGAEQISQSHVDVAAKCREALDDA